VGEWLSLDDLELGGASLSPAAITEGVRASEPLLFCYPAFVLFGPKRVGRGASIRPAAPSTSLGGISSSSESIKDSSRGPSSSGGTRNVE
jgi:hypothetical protein